MLTRSQLKWLEEVQYALSLTERTNGRDSRGERIFKAIFQGVNFSDGNPTREQVAKLIRHLYLKEKAARYWKKEGKRSK